MQFFKRTIFTISLLTCLSSIIWGNNVQVSNVSFNPIGNAGQITFDISWENSWRQGINDQYHDAVWVFVKFAPNGGPQWLHADIQVTSSGSNIEVLEPNDLKGAFIRRANQGMGTVPVSSVTFDVNNNTGLYPDFKVFAIEMVYIPQGPFYLGDGASDGRFHVGNDVNQPYLVTNSAALKIGTSSTEINSLVNTPPIDIPATYPNGYDAFYCMKYEVTQGQYIEFLHTLDRGQQNNHTATDISGTNITNVYVMLNSTTNLGRRQGIKCPAILTTSSPVEFYCDFDNDNIGNEINDGQNIITRHVNDDDYYAYLDWAALRPMTELEYEKACRGPLPPVANEMAWGSTVFTNFNTLDITNPGSPDESVSQAGTSAGIISNNSATTASMRAGFAATPSSSRTLSGAGYYGVLDLSGNGNEVTISAATTGSLHFTGVLGDGMLDPQGLANEADWQGRSEMIRGLLSTGSNHTVSDRFSSGGLGSPRIDIGAIRGVRQF
ncbi:MAG: SUMF1/EgtB/PvdO family nonheme iron enzyme [Saprospiraceae bacterium]|nr:SUMF1/EgtB/PvdO family nonheme iron enzyme [Saprospiraceae bacterium]